MDYRRLCRWTRRLLEEFGHVGHTLPPGFQVNVILQVILLRLKLHCSKCLVNFQEERNCQKRYIYEEGLKVYQNPLTPLYTFDSVTLLYLQLIAFIK